MMEYETPTVNVEALSEREIIQTSAPFIDVIGVDPLDLDLMISN